MRFLLGVIGHRIVHIRAASGRQVRIPARLQVCDLRHLVDSAGGQPLAVDLDAFIPGLVSEIDGSITYSSSDSAEVYSVVDEIARRALYTGARVLGARRDNLPDRAPLAAILRYQFG